MIKTKPIDSVKSGLIRVPISTFDDLRWIQANIKEQLTIPSFGRLAEKAIKRLRRDMEKK